MAGESIDAAVLEELESVVGREVVIDLLASFDSDAENLIAQARAAFAAGDVQALTRATHTLKSTSETFGARQLGRLCGDVEALGRGGQLSTREQIAAIESELSVVRPLLAARAQ